MKAISLVVFFVVVIVMVERGSGSRNGSYIILAPNIITPGQILKVKVSILNTSEPVEVKAGIMDVNKIRLVASKNGSFQPGSTGELNIKIPSVIPCTRVCSFFAKGHSSGSLRFHKHTRIQVRQKRMSIYVQTDKGIYKPGQTVHMRVFALFPDLTSYKGKMTISVLDPNNNKMAQWVDLQNPIGIIKKDFPISSQPVKGSWRIVVKAHRESAYRNFEVKHYVLPKFEVAFTLPPYVLKKDTKLTGHVTSKYTYGKGVHGTVILDVYFSRIQRTIRRKFELNGTAAFTYDMEEIKELFLSTHTWARKSYLYQYTYLLTFDATVTDKLTGRRASTKKTVSFYQTDVKLQFPSFNPSNFKPGLPFIVVLKVTKPNGQMHHPDYLKTLTIHTTTKYKWNGNATRRTYQPSHQGTIIIAIEVPSFAKSVNIEASYRNATRIFTRAWFSASKSLSPSNSFIKLSTSTPSVKSGDNIQCRITSNFLMSTYMYLVLGRGGIRHIGSGVVQGNGDYNATFSLTSLPIMSPSARIVTYSVTNDSEIVVDSLTVSVENPFKNKVSLEFSTNTSRPGDEIKLVAKATAGSQVAFLAVDKSVLLMKKNNDISQSQVLKELQSYSTGSGWYPWWDWGWWECFVPFYVGGVDAYSVFKNAGLIVFSDGLVYKKPVPPWRRLFRILDSAPASPESEEAIDSPKKASPKKIRSFFPETWIWADLNASSTGEAQLTTKVPDTITSWIASAFAISPSTGFGISPLKPKLQVFQPFFISLDLPYSVIRGEQVAIKVLVFNYLDEDQQVTVTFKASKDWSVANVISVRSLNEEATDLKEILSVPAGQGKSIAFPIIPKVLGGIILTVHAQSSSAADAVQRTLLVEPEGIPQEYSYSILVDLNSTSSFARNLQLSLPETVVDGSSHIKVTLIGDMLGSSFSNLDKLLRMPYGCGEQNMVNFAPNIYILKYLKAVNRVTPDIKDKAENYMLTGYQREQTYRHRDGSYSAFGERDKQGSMWLTAFVVKSFAQARKFIFIDPKSLDLSLRWMVQKQNKDGSFPRVGYVHSSYLKGGLKGELPLTAFVVIALSETKSSSEKLNLAKILAVRYLEKNLNRIILTKDVYSLAITAYALKLENSPSSNRALLALLSFAIQKDGTLHWSVEKKSLDKSTSFRPYYRPRSADIEVTAYALLTLSLFNDINNGLSVLRWLSRQRNSLGGYASTQDTVLGIQALSEFAARVYSPTMNFKLTLSHSALKSFSRTLTVNGGNSMILQQVLIPKAEGILKVNASGYGIGMLQVGVTYHVTKAPLKTNFNFTVKNVKEQRNHIKTQVCAQWKGKGKSSSMSVIEMTILSGFSADEERVNKLMEDESLFLKRVDFQNKKLIFYFDQINKRNATCLSVQFDRTHNIGKGKPVPAVVYDYYNPENRAEALYSLSQVKDVNICSVCPSCFGCNASPTNSSNKQETTIPTQCTVCQNQTKPRVNVEASLRKSTGTTHSAGTCKVTMLSALALLLQTVV